MTDLPQRLMAAFMRINRQNRQRHHADGMRHHEFWLLHAIVRMTDEAGAGPRVSDLSEALKVSAPTVSQQADELERRGLVERRRGESDRRSVRISLSPEGKALLERHRQEVLSMYSAVAGHLGGERAETLAALLEASADFLEEPK